jgi:hypothetical protein
MKDSLARFGSVELTAKSIVQENNSFWSGTTNEIYLNKLDSIVYGYRRNFMFFIGGFILVMLGLYSMASGVSGIGTIPLIVGCVLLLFGLLRHEVVEFRAGTLRITEYGRGAHEFVESVRSELRKKEYI